MNPNVLKVQTRLKELGFDPGPLDGVRGRATIAAVRQFQTSRGLESDGLVGPVTYTALFDNEKAKFPDSQVVPPKVSFDAAPWMDEVQKVMNLHEVTHKKTLWDWLRLDKASVGDPTVYPWCGDLVQTAIALSMPNEPIPTNPYLARNWMKFGIPCTPQFGAVVVFWREHKTQSHKGHVGFYVGETATHVLTRGGNQSNRVNDSLIAKDRLLGYRWPSTALTPSGQRVMVDGKGAVVTTNEA